MAGLVTEMDQSYKQSFLEIGNMLTPGEPGLELSSLDARRRGVDVVVGW
jgi:hypothetical protein